MIDKWKYTEECLEPVVPSMGHLLVMIRKYISARLMDGQSWNNLLDRAGEVPSTFAAFPFGFEIPLQDPEPRADFGMALVGGSRTSQIIQDRGRAENPGRSIASLAWLLNETDHEDSELRRVIGRKMLLEYDIERTATASPPDPGIFLYPVDGMLGGGDEQFSELATVYNALIHAGGWNADDAERQQIRRFYNSVPPDRFIKAFGTFPSRSRTMRVAVTGFKAADEVVTFLENAGWPGDRSAVGEIVAFYDMHKAFAYLGLHFDVTASGPGMSLGLSFFAKEKEWLKDIESWTPVIKAIGEQGNAVPWKLSELMRWSTGSATLFMKSGPVVLVRGIHHIKLSISQNGVDAAKAYVFFLMMAARERPAANSD